MNVQAGHKRVLVRLLSKEETDALISWRDPCPNAADGPKQMGSPDAPIVFPHSESYGFLCGEVPVHGGQERMLAVFREVDALILEIGGARCGLVNEDAVLLRWFEPVK